MHHSQNMPRLASCAVGLQGLVHAMVTGTSCQQRLKDRHMYTQTARQLDVQTDGQTYGQTDHKVLGTCPAQDEQALHSAQIDATCNRGFKVELKWVASALSVLQNGEWKKDKACCLWCQRRTGYCRSQMHQLHEPSELRVPLPLTESWRSLCHLVAVEPASHWHKTFIPQDLTMHKHAYMR